MLRKRSLVEENLRLFQNPPDVLVRYVGHIRSVFCKDIDDTGELFVAQRDRDRLRNSGYPSKKPDIRS